MSPVFDLNPKTVTQLFRDLFSRDVTVRRIDKPAALGTGGKDLVAVYADETGAPRAVCACPLATAATFGAALSLMPAGRAAEAVRDGKLDESLMENFREVCNVLVGLFDAPGMPPLSVSDVTTGSLPQGVFDEAARVVMGVDINGYDEGTMFLATTQT